jgi:hypothetical protein
VAEIRESTYAAGLYARYTRPCFPVAGPNRAVDLSERMAPRRHRQSRRFTCFAFVGECWLPKHASGGSTTATSSCSGRRQLLPKSSECDTLWP